LLFSLIVSNFVLRASNFLLQTLKDIIKNKDSNRDKTVSREWQKYGYDLAQKLGDPSHVSLFIRLAQKTDRQILDDAWSFVADANARNKIALFMWKIKQLKEERKKIIAKKLIITGIVQHVFFRDFVKKNADKLKIKGYVKNLENGEGEAIFENDEDTVNKLIEKCRKGPRKAQVTNISINEVPVKKYAEFTIDN
jgi:acylphosphatase